MAYLGFVHQTDNKTKKMVFLPSGRKTVNAHPFATDDRFSCVDIKNKKEMYSPKDRAKFLYEAITAKNDNGEYLYHNIYLIGGNGAEDTIKALETLLKDKQETLPQRQNDLNIFGFSDASQLHHYLGQRGVATPIYYSGKMPQKFYSDIMEALRKQKENEPFVMNLTVVNNPENKIKIDGFTQPGSITSVEHRPTHQLQPFSEGSNMLVIELINEVQITRLAQTLDQMKEKDISLILSKDTTPQMVQKIKERFTHLTILFGALVGHGSCIKEAIPIPLFAASHIEIQGHQAQMTISPFASEQAKELQYNPKRTCPKIIEDLRHATNEVRVKSLDWAGRSILSDLTKVHQNAPQYTIYIDRADPDFTWQKMELGVKELLEKGIINPDVLQQLDFKGDCEADKLNRMTSKVMKELAGQYLPKLKKLTYNDIEIPFKGLESLLPEKSATKNDISATKSILHKRPLYLLNNFGNVLDAEEIMQL